MKRPETTLFMLTSVDGKISTGDRDIMDVDKDFPTITGLKEGLQQYYDLEKQTDFFFRLIRAGYLQRSVLTKKLTNQ
jgi:2,5-diamino-6-(ribosylamino)-4(3H)-pyrimidinone 5'-phosphate reductase